MIVVERVTPEAYSALFSDRAPGLHTEFDSPAFTQLYTHKCRSIHYLAFRRRNRVVAGIIAGETDGMLQSPFSAPYGGFTLMTAPAIALLTELTDSLIGYARERGLGIRITLPPVHMAPAEISAWAYVLGLREGVKITTDINYHIPLDGTAAYDSRMAPAARRNLRRAFSSNLNFHHPETTPEAIKRAYAIIKANHEAMGYPMNVSEADTVRTCVALHGDVFTIAAPDGADVAAAIFYRSCKGIAHNAVWGDIPAYRSLRPMNFLAHSIASHYRNEGLKTLDLGTASLCGHPQHGLCHFKETLSALPSLKYTFMF